MGEEKGQRKGKRLIAQFKDKTGVLELVWFKGIRWIKSGVKLHTEYIVFGKPSFYKGIFNIVHPELDLQEEKQEFLGCIRRAQFITVLYKQTSNTMPGEFLGRLVLGVEDEEVKVFGATIY